MAGLRVASQGLPAAWLPFILAGMVTMLIGTNRPNSNTHKVAAQLKGIYAEERVPLKVLDLAQLPAEIFSPTSYAKKPESFSPSRRQCWARPGCWCDAGIQRRAAEC